MAKEDAGKGLDLDVGHRAALDFGKAAHLLLGEADVVEGLLVDFRDETVDFVRSEAKVVRRPPIELLRVRADGCVATVAHLRDDPGHGLLD